MKQEARATEMVNPAAADARKAIASAPAKAPLWRKWAVAVLLAIHTGLLAYGALVHSPTYNEPAHLVAGISYWKFGRFDVYSVNPPLVRLVAAVPVLLAGCETDWKSFHEQPGIRSEMPLGSNFCSANGYRTTWLVTMARWACIPFSLFGGYICFRWGRDLYGPSAGVLSLTLWCFCPNIIAHGQLITCDAAATALGVAACYAFWRWLKSPTWRNAIASGLLLGLASLAKTTLLVFYPLWPLLWLTWRWPERRGMAGRDWARQLGLVCLSLLIGLYGINLGYAFEGTLTRLGDFKFISRSFSGLADPNQARLGGNRFADSWLGAMPVPLPKNYLIGIDQQRKDCESFGNEFYLGGVWSRTGWWYYYLYALAIKVPLGTWLLIPLALGIRVLNGPAAQFRDELFLLVPAIVILALVSSQTGLNEHLRYVLPIFPFVFIWLGRAATSLSIPARARQASPARAITAGLIGILVAWSTVSSLKCYPHSLSYFNEIVGGMKNGWKYLTNSNVDWGQDLLYLKQWSDEHPNAGPLRIAVHGPIDPKLIGIDGDVFSPYVDELELSPGCYAVSALFLSGFGQPDHGRKLQAELERIGAYETIGGSIVVFVKE